MSIPLGFEKVVLTEAKGEQINLPQAFRGIVLTFSLQTVFVNVKNGLNRPISGLLVSTVFNGETLSGFTDSNGEIQILCNDFSTIRFTKEKSFQTLPYNRAIQGDLINYVFHVPLLE